MCGCKNSRYKQAELNLNAAALRVAGVLAWAALGGRG